MNLAEQRAGRSPQSWNLSFGIGDDTGYAVTFRFHRFARSGRSPESSDTCSVRIARAREYVGGHLEEKISNEKLAAVACLSPAYFARRFKNETGLTPGGYVRWARLREAKRLLRDTELPLSEIAYRCGFCSQSHMTVLFGSDVGVTPKQFRTQNRGSALPRASSNEHGTMTVAPTLQA